MKTQKTTIQNKPKTRAMTERVTARNPILALLLRLLWAAALVLHTSRAQAGVVFTTLHSFTANSDGAAPLAGLLLSGNTLYGTASGGGTNGSGTVFSLNTDATGFTMLHSFTALDLTTHANNSDGGRPEAGLILSGNTLYGTAYVGGTNGSGTVFAVNTNGTGFAIVYSFTADFGFETTNSDGAGPLAALISSGSTLYGTTYYGGSSGKGTVFAVSTAGTLFTNLYSFTALSNGGYGTNSDGANPNAGLILSSNTLFGTAFIGGTNGNGTVFALNTDGTGFTNLHTFTSGGYNDQFYATNSDGANPNAGLLLSGNTLYGTTSQGGPSGYGSVFKVNTDGTGFTNLHYFTAASGAYPHVTNSDGVFPNAGLILSGNTLYGVATSGGTNGNGTVFALNTDGTDFTVLHCFTATDPSTGTNSDGALSQAGLILSGNTLYGTTYFGGSSGNGTVFSLTLPVPQLTITPSGANVILAWPTNYIGFTLQATSNLMSPVWTTDSVAPVIVNGQYGVTNPISGTQQFFRLSQ